MSYCRFSSMDFQCDIYLYADVSGGWTTCVAGNRISIDSSSLPPEVDITEDADAWFARHELVMDAIDKGERVPIDLPHAGGYFRDDDIQTVVERLRELKALGYRFPDSVIEELLADQEEETSDG